MRTEADARDAVARRLTVLVDEHGDEQAIEFVDQASPEARVWWTWRDVGAVRDALIPVLASAAVPVDAAVVIVMRQRPAMLACELAVLSLGRASLLVTPLAGDVTLADEVGALRPVVLVAHTTDWARPGFADAVAAAGSVAIEVDDTGAVAVRHAPQTLPDGPAVDGAVTVLTSGTTGPPKRLPVAWTTFVRLGGGPDGRTPRSGRGAIILTLPLVTLGGLLSVARLVFLGRPIAVLERFEVRAWAALVREHRPTTIGAPPPVVQMILDADITPDHFEGVTAYLTSSAAIPAETLRRFEQRYGFPVLLGYGATEFLNSVTGWTVDLWREFGATKAGSAGRAVAGVRLRVLDPISLDRSGEPVEVAAGAEGILEVDPPQRARNLPTGWLRTADRARIDEDGFVWILGRADDVIVRGGFKVDLTAIEDALTEHPSVEAGAVVGLPDERLGSVPGAVVVPASGTGIDAEELCDWLRLRVPAYAVPTVMEVVPSIPRTSTLKPDRVAILRLLTG